MIITSIEDWTDDDVKDYIFNRIMDDVCLKELYDFDPEWKFIDKETELIFSEIKDIKTMTLEDLDFYIDDCVVERDISNKVREL